MNRLPPTRNPVLQLLSRGRSHGAEAAFSIIAATAAGCETKTEWLPATSSTVEPARSDIICWAGGGIIRSSVVRRYQLGLFRQAGSLIVPPRASTPHGT